MESHLLPDISHWDRVYHIDSEKDYLKHEFTELTDNQIKLIEKFVKDHNKYYICSRKNKNLTLCKEIT